jgi:hypothetical protein
MIQSSRHEEQAQKIFQDSLETCHFLLSLTRLLFCC